MSSKFNGALPTLVISNGIGKHCAEKEKQSEMMKDESSNGHMDLAITKCNGETKSNLVEIINHFAAKLNHIKLHFLGYPTNLDFNYEALAPLFHFHINNVGDPFTGSSFSSNSTEFEVCVLDWFAKLFEIGKSEYWGYVTSGGTEGNFHGILSGREQFPDGILYISEDSHYSIFKIAKICRMQCVKVKTLISGEIDCVDLKALLLAHKNRPAIMNLNIGTTMKGAIDDIDLVVQTLEESGFRDRFYIHCDAALFGLMLPFIKQAPRLSFKKPIGSIAISGHKFIGCPIPCGVTIARLENINVQNRDVEYIASRDDTIAGSRSGHAVMFLWYALKQKDLIEFEKEVHTCIKNAQYLLDQLRDSGIGAMLNEFSNTVFFERPLDDEFSRRWHLACKNNFAHVVVMQHDSVETLDRFVAEFRNMRSVWFNDGVRKPLCVASDLGAENCSCTLHNSLL